MGATFCERHEISGIVWVCPHIDSCIWSQAGPDSVGNPELASPADLRSISLRRIKVLAELRLPYAYCAACASRHKLPSGEASQTKLLLFHLPGLLAYKKETVGQCMDCLYLDVFGIELSPECGELPFMNTTQELPVTRRDI